MKKNKFYQNLVTEERLWQLAAAGTAMLAGTLVRSAMTKGWKAYTRKDPPVNPAANDTNWKEALTWTIATSIAMGVAQLIARHGTDVVWKKAMGKRPGNANATVAGW